MGIVIVVSGPPGAGKSTFATIISSRLMLPLISKDHYKESLFDTLGYSDREHSIQLGAAAFELQHLVAKELVRANVDFVLETAFHRTSTPRLRDVLKDAEIVQIWLTAEIDILIQRGRARPRHPGHGGWSPSVEEELRQTVREGRYDPLDLGGDLHRLDTNCFDTTHYEGIINELVERFA